MATAIEPRNPLSPKSHPTKPMPSLKKRPARQNRNWPVALASARHCLCQVVPIARESVRLQEDPFLAHGSEPMYSDARRCQAPVLIRCWLTRSLIDLKIVRKLHPLTGPPGFDSMKARLRLALNTVRHLERTIGIDHGLRNEPLRRWTKNELARWRLLHKITDELLALLTRTTPDTTQQMQR